MANALNALLMIELALSFPETIARIRELNEKRKAEGRDDFTLEEVRQVQELSKQQENDILNKISE